MLALPHWPLVRVRFCFVLSCVETRVVLLSLALNGNATLAVLNLDFNAIGASGMSSLASGARFRVCLATFWYGYL